MVVATIITISQHSLLFFDHHSVVRSHQYLYCVSVVTLKACTYKCSNGCARWL